MLRKLRNIVALRILGLCLLYCGTLYAARWLAFQLRFDFSVPPEHEIQLVYGWPFDLAVRLVFLLVFGQFSGLLSFFSIPDLRRVVAAMLGSTAILFLVRFSPHAYMAAPRGVVLVDFFLSTTALVTVRLTFRLVRERYLMPESDKGRRHRRVGIVGAGDVGAMLAKDLLSRRGLGLRPVAVFDDDKTKWNSELHGVPVVGAPEAVLNQKLNLELEEVILAMPSAPAKRVGEIVSVLQKAHLRFEMVPSLHQLALGQLKVSQLREVEIQDLLGRDPVKLETENISQILKNQVVMVTGAGGSIGSELCRQIASFYPARLLLVEQSEVQMFQIEQELVDLGYSGTVLPLIADLLDEARMRHIFQRFRPAVVFHAAAHKHVPMMESQPSEAIKNNVLGSARVAELSLEFGVDRFVMISTDKAINPTNVMGATKRLSEIYMQSLHAVNPGKTKFMAVRFGNVLGSSGSVIPTFKKQIAAGGPVKVTHPEVTRYFMTIPEAVGLVLQSAAQGSGGEIFVLDMGNPVKIVDLARQLIELSGLRPGDDIEIQFVGLRPGEKLFEEINHQGENMTPTQHPKIVRFVCEPQPLEEVRAQLEQLTAGLHEADPSQLKLRLKAVVPEYQPYLT